MNCTQLGKSQCVMTLERYIYLNEYNMTCGTCLKVFVITTGLCSMSKTSAQKVDSEFYYQTSV